MKLISKSSKNIQVFLFFLIILFIGLSIFKDYGVHWDEVQNQRFGKRWVDYIADTVAKKEVTEPEFIQKHDWVHGPAIEIAFNFIHSKVLKLTQSRQIIFIRHLLTFLTFYLGLIFFYLLLALYFKNYKICLLGVLFLLLTPRIFGHSFYNSVDIPFLSFYIISVYVLHKLIDRKTFYFSLLHALVCAILINIRQIGIILPIFTGLFFLIDIFKSTHSTYPGQKPGNCSGLMLSEVEVSKETRKKNVKLLVIYLLALILLVYIFWPLVWYKPNISLPQAIEKITTSAWNWEVLYQGNYINAGQLPWHYSLVWMLITIPIGYIIAFILGLFTIFKNKKVKKYYFFPLAGLFLPLLGTILLKIRLYDSWRHLFFIYPFFVFISLQGFVFVFNIIKKKATPAIYKTFTILLISITIASPVYFMIKYHPHQNLYFNRFAGKDMKEIKENFELDYWGLSYRKALEYILQNDRRNGIQIYAANLSGEDNVFILPEKERNRIFFSPNPFLADYFMGNFRWHKEDYYGGDDFYNVKIGNAKIMVVYKLR